MENQFVTATIFSKVFNMPLRELFVSEFEDDPEKMALVEKYLPKPFGSFHPDGVSVPETLQPRWSARKSRCFTKGTGILRPL